MAMMSTRTSSVFEFNSREELLKKRFSGIIRKSQNALNEKMKKEQGAYPCAAAKRSCTKVSGSGDKMKIIKSAREAEMKELRRDAKIQKKREASRRELENMRDTCGFNDSGQALREFEKLIGNNSGNRHVSFTPYGSNTLLFKFAKEAELEGSADCWEKYKESFCHTKLTTDTCCGHVQNIVYANNGACAEKVAVKGREERKIRVCCNRVKSNVIKESKERETCYELEEGEIVD